MPLDIDLTPREEILEQKKKTYVKIGSVIAFVVLFITLLISGYFFVVYMGLSNQINSLNAQIGGLRSEISDLSDVEISARNLDIKVSYLTKMFNNRDNYSVLMEELEKRIPAGTFIDNSSLGPDNTINLSGKSENYLLVSQFVNNISDPNFANAGEGLSSLFVSVSLNSVSLDQQSAFADYFIVVQYDPALLRR